MKIEGKKVILNQTINLSNTQILKLKNMTNIAEKLLYLSSFDGNRSFFKFKTDWSSLPKDELKNKKSGNILTALRKMEDMSEDVNHTPIVNTEKNRWVGVEIECYLNNLVEDCDVCEGTGRDEDGDECYNCDGGIFSKVRDILKSVGLKNVSVRSDGSLRDGGVEICYMFDANKGYDGLKKLTETLNKHGAKINGSCGLHVHLNQYEGRNDIEKIYRLGDQMERLLPALLKFIPASRRENRYCQPRASRGEKYSAINMSKSKETKTIEYRLHTGSVNFEKISNWIKLLIHCEDKCKQGYYKSFDRELKGIDMIKSFFTQLQIPEELILFYKQRYSMFNAIANSDDEIAGVNESISDWMPVYTAIDFGRGDTSVEVNILERSAS